LTDILYSYVIVVHFVKKCLALCATRKLNIVVKRICRWTLL